ncbi:MAG: hypothetical protein Q4P36_00980 [Bowdeniella nasicola]|nr:hypothetical protein [Bowdeniella nasicola]
MYPLYENFPLTCEMRERVSDYLREVDFHLPGTTPDDFTPMDEAVYLGWNFQTEDLEAFAVGLVCTKEGHEQERTFIRMSRGQLLGEADAPRLSVNPPVRGRDALRMQRWRPQSGPIVATGVDSYARPGDAVPGVDVDLTLLEDTLSDIEIFAAAGRSARDEGQFDFAVDFGTLLAGRYMRLKHFEEAGRLSPEELARLTAFEERCRAAQEILTRLNLPTLADVATPEKRRHPQHR